jgi:hypothetical protein
VPEQCQGAALKPARAPPLDPAKGEPLEPITLVGE